MKNIKITLIRAILVIAFVQTLGNLFAQDPTFISANTANDLSPAEKELPAATQKQEKVKLISNQRNVLKSLVFKEDSLKSLIVAIEKDIKKNLAERDQLAATASTLDRLVKSKEWTSVNNQYKENVKAYSNLARMRQEQKSYLFDIQKQKEFYIKNIQQEEVLLTRLKEKVKDENKRELAGN